MTTVDLSTEYLGLQLKNPLVTAACPATANMDILKDLEHAGIAAVVMPSLFEEQVEFEESQFGSLLELGDDFFAEASGFFPHIDKASGGVDHHLQMIESACAAVSIPVIGSLNGVTSGGWTRYAKRIEETGVAALELNMYDLPTDASVTADQVEERYLQLVSEVKSQISIPLAVKIGPYFSSPANFAGRLCDAGADGLVLFNRFMQPDIDLDTMQINPQIELSRHDEMRLPLRWIAILHGQIDASFAATSGIHGHRDVVKLLMAGADVTMIASAILRRGPEVVQTILDDLQQWLQKHDYPSISVLRGSMSHQNSPNATALERANYMKVLTSYTGPHV